MKTKMRVACSIVLSVVLTLPAMTFTAMYKPNTLHGSSTGSSQAGDS